MNEIRNYAKYINVKNAVLHEDATVNWVAEQLNCKVILARCLVKDWKKEQDELS